MKKKFFVILGVSIFLTMLFTACEGIDGMDPDKFPQPRLDFADGWVKIEYQDNLTNWVESPLPPGRNWGQVAELPAMTIKKDAVYQISLDTSFVTGRFLDRYTVAKKGHTGEDTADIIYEEDPEITWVDWTLTYNNLTLTAEELAENLPIRFLANEYLLGLREELRKEIGNTSPPFLSAAIAPDIISGLGRPTIINSNVPFNVFSRVECTITYTIRFTYTYQYRDDDRFRLIEKTEDKTFTFHVVQGE